MKITTILGSPRKRGNTAKLLDIVESKLAEGGHSIERVIIADLKINGCKGCYACKKKEEGPNCVQKDDAPGVFDKMIKSDAVIYATPLYCWCFPAQMKALIDRHLCLVSEYGTENHTSLVKGLRTALLVTCEDKVEDNADLIQILFDRLNEYLRTEMAVKYVLPFCGIAAKLPPEAEQVAAMLSDDIIEALQSKD